MKELKKNGEKKMLPKKTAIYCEYPENIKFIFSLLPEWPNDTLYQECSNRSEIVEGQDLWVVLDKNGELCTDYDEFLYSTDYKEEGIAFLENQGYSCINYNVFMCNFINSIFEIAEKGLAGVPILESATAVPLSADNPLRNLFFACDTSSNQNFSGTMSQLSKKMLNRYQKAGTVEECEEAVSKQKARHPFHIGYRWEGKVICPVGINGNPYDLCPCCETNLLERTNYCSNCGQKIDWAEIDIRI